MKTCTKCKRELDESSFDKHKCGKDGIRSICKDCRRISLKQWRLDNPEQCRSLAKRNRENNFLRLYCSSAVSNKRRESKYTVLITSSELHEIALRTTHCPICGKELDYHVGKISAKDNSPSLDRINNEDIITRDNVWIICNKCNVSKSNRTLKEFKDYCAMVASKDF